MPAYRSIRIHVELWAYESIRPDYGTSPMTMLAEFSCDTCERTAFNRHLVCPECGAIWATQVVHVRGQPVPWSVSMRCCPAHNDGTLIGAPDVYSVHSNTPLTRLVERELRLPGLAHVLGLEPVPCE